MHKRKFIKREHIKQGREEIREGIEYVVGEEEYSAWKKFAFKGRMVEMAIAFMIGAAFKNVVGSISENLIMPVINFILDKTGTDWRELTVTPIEGIALEIGQFLGAFVDFILISIILYILYRKILAPILEDDKKIKCIETVQCPNCCKQIYYKCKRCPNCTSWLNEQEQHGL